MRLDPELASFPRQKVAVNEWNGAHDLVGVRGLRKVVVESSEPVLHADWEKVVFPDFEGL